ncbi:MAG: ABC transporter ATP-binding protein [Peptoniphilaceae bacterium]|uniref:ABC transporter ATP-binding protein n=1 Tax=Parvimonas sp. TaxID=1944660 RepID=UPI0025F0C35C|nr:ABC transporter ATP-binding protein [Parvimonas sp.]MCI5997600.1 ABC transporter ATP-binding protein [Parvimonas sp.]MDD7765195.1 ABC transporter ATP-binding protein [Peptoniphilaceae bacterium]MDY3051188.1 ABC transporter ATP-binding protein [Parvimonas sp.]
MIEFKNVSKVFSKGVKAVDNVSFKINEGEIFGFLGPNGAGKSTSLKMLVGILEQSEGTITVNGIDTLKNSMEVKEIISYVPDNPDIYTKMTGIKYLNFICDIYGVDESVRKKRIEEYNAKLELGDAIYTTIESYSHGMRQKLVLIGALITDPKVIILDEPMVGLDVKTSFNLKTILREFADSGKIVIFSTHVMEVAEKICDKVGIINKGKIVFCGNIQELKQENGKNEDLEKIFLELTENE